MNTYVIKVHIYTCRIHRKLMITDVSKERARSVTQEKNLGISNLSVILFVIKICQLKKTKD